MTELRTDVIEKLVQRLERSEGKLAESILGGTGLVIDSSVETPMKEVQNKVYELARQSTQGQGDEAFVLLQGDCGVGKEAIARQIHCQSRRSKGAWISVNCAELSWDALEKELFGTEVGYHGNSEKKLGALELSQGGTLYLGNVEFLSHELQSRVNTVFMQRLFRRIGGSETISFNSRIICGTTTQLATVVETGQFSQNLFQFVSRVTINVPNLVARKNEIIPLANAYAKKLFDAAGKKFYGFNSEFEKSLLDYNWPGNVRELYNLVERFSLFFSGEGRVNGVAYITGSPQPAAGVNKGTLGKLELVSVNGTPVVAESQNTDESYMSVKKRWGNTFERDYLVRILIRHHGNVSSAAREAKLDRSNFLRLLRRHSIKAQEYRLSKNTKTEVSPASSEVTKVAA